MKIRQAQPADALAIAQVHIRTWQIAYRDLLPAPFLAHLSPESQATRYTFQSEDPQDPKTIVAIDDNGEIRGFASTMPSRDPDRLNHGLEAYGELCALYVDPDHWARGIGAALITRSRADLVALGFNRAILWILAGNQRADRFYRLDGWLPDGATKTETRPGGITLNELRYHRDL
jgi:GNAT superfamily N-acetyltransferase